MAHLRAAGNLSYLEFIRVVDKVWTDSHPDIPFFPTAGDQYAKYPCIVYSLQLRKTFQNESKPRYREEMIAANGDIRIITGQRFQNVVIFTVITETDPHMAEELIEVFEDFMLEFTPVFKELGISELLYARRLPDSEENRPGQGVVKRSISYLVTTEKVVKTTVSKLDEITANVRIYLAENQAIETATPATPIIAVIVDQFANDQI